MIDNLDKQPIEIQATRLTELAASGDVDGLQRLAAAGHPADLSAAFAQLDEELQLRLLELWPPQSVAELLLEIGGHLAVDYFADVPVERAARAISVLDADEAADLLADIEPPLRERILAAASRETAAEISDLLTYPEDSAGGRMSLDYVSVPERLTVGRARGEVQQSIGDEQHINLYLTDDGARLVGVVFMERLASAAADKPLRDLIETDYKTVGPAMDQEELAALFQRYDLLAVPVTDDDGLLLGEVTVDDILDVLREEATEDIFKMAATSDEELEVRSAFSVVRLRLPWLLVCLLGALFSGTIIGLFSYAIEQVIALAGFIPVITAMGGNAGLQSSTVVVRNLALGRAEPKNILRSALRELRVGALLGFFCGLIVGALAWAVGGNPMLGVVVGTAMVGAIIIATLVGAFMPLFFKRIGVDPALASGPFITTANDIIGLTIYLGLGMLMLDLLL